MTPATWLAVAGGLAVTLVAAELVARAWLRRSGYFVWPRYFRREMPVDPAVSRHLDPRVRFWINSDGERGDEAPTGPGTFRVLMVGGSMVESTSNDQSTTWCARLQSLLNEPEALATLGAKRVHVGNVGKSGLDARAVELVLERTLPRYGSLQAIGLAVGAGDVLRWLEAGAPADRLPPALAVTTVFAESPEMEVGWHPRRLALRELARRARARFFTPVEHRSRAAGWMLRARAMRKNAELFIDEVPDAGHLLDAFETALEAATIRAKQRAERVLLIRQPAFKKSNFTSEEESLFWNGGIGNAHQGDEVRQFFTTRVMYALLDEVDKRMRRVASRQRVTYVDTEAAMTFDAVRFFDHFHLTPRGAGEVAAAVQRAMLSAPRVDRPSESPVV